MQSQTRVDHERSNGPKRFLFLRGVAIFLMLALLTLILSPWGTCDFDAARGVCAVIVSLLIMCCGWIMRMCVARTHAESQQLPYFLYMVIMFLYVVALIYILTVAVIVHDDSQHSLCGSNGWIHKRVCGGFIGAMIFTITMEMILVKIFGGNKIHSMVHSAMYRPVNAIRSAYRHTGYPTTVTPMDSGTHLTR